VDDQIGFVEFQDRVLAVATMINGALRQGRFGTAGPDLHQQVSRHAERCVCGRTGCFAWHLSHGSWSDDMLRIAIPHVVSGLAVARVGLQCPAVRGLLDLPDAEPSVEMIDADLAGHLRRDGLRSACSMAVLRRAVERAFAPRQRRVINHSAFRPIQLAIGESHERVATS
jgi:hypothetical protein